MTVSDDSAQTAKAADRLETPGESTGSSPSGLNSAPMLAAALLAVPAVLLGVLVCWLLPTPWWLGIVLGLLVAVAIVWARLRNADSVVLKRLPGASLSSRGADRVDNLVQGLSLAAGVAAPELVFVHDQASNAMAVRNGERNWIVMTTGLLDGLEVVELEGIVAQLLVRLRNGDAEAATRTAALLSLPILDGPLRALLGPVATAGLDRSLDADRDLSADRQAVALTRYPPGLMSAFLAAERRSLSPAPTTNGLKHMWLIDPEEHAGGGDERSRVPLDLRIDVLGEL